MKFKLVQTQRGDLASFVIVNNGSGLPHLHATEWLLRFRGTKSQNTIINRGQDICSVLEWGQLRSIDIIQRLQSNYGFNIAELTDLGKFLGTNHRVTLNTQKVFHQIGSRTHQRRIRTTIQFFRWIATGALLKLNIDDKKFDRLNEKIKIIEAQLRDLTPTNPPVNLTSSKGISDNAQAQLIQIITPASKQNPFLPELQLRNFVIVGLFFTLGLRLGELLALKFEDINFGHLTTIHVVKRKVDGEETRMRPPKPKRGNRSLTLAQSSLALALANYVNLSSSDQTCPFLITTRAGNALTTRAVQQIFIHLRNTFPNILPSDFSPHSGRHTMSAGLERKMVKALVPEADRRQYLKAVRGDTCDKSQDTYINITIENIANRHLLDYQHEIYQDA
jgi:integrase